MKIGILGGTFNPVHSEHVNMARCAIKELSLDKLIVMPDYLPPHKEGLPAPAQDRLNMLKIAFNGVEKAEISDYEILNGEKSYTYITVEHFKKLFSDDELYFIVGGDMLVDFKTWKYPERILSCANLAVICREDFFADYKREEKYFKDKFNKSFIKLSYSGKPFSSTEIRVYFELGLSTDGICIEEVGDYIKKHGLYKGDKYCEFIKRTLNEKRLIHTAEVVVTALSKAKELNLDAEKVRISALLHDCAKYLSPDSFKDFVLPEGVPTPVVHAFLGAYVVEKVLGVCDEEIIDAIKYHTSGKANMSLLGKLIFVSDMVEKGRDYEGVEILRELYKRDFDECFKKCLEEEMKHLLNKKKNIFIETLNAYDYYINNKKD